MNEQFEKWLNSKDHGIWPTRQQVEFAEKAWNAAIESTKARCHDVDEFYRGVSAPDLTPEMSFGCHFRTENNFNDPWDECILDGPLDDDDLCDYARDNQINARVFCPHWKGVK